MKQSAETTADKAAAVIAAAAGLATATVSGAATEATKALSVAASAALLTVETAAEKALHIIEIAAAKAVEAFPNLQADMREIHSSQAAQTSTIVTVVTELLRNHTEAEEVRLTGISNAVENIEGHMVRQNGRLTKAETHITRQNLIIFGIAGPVGLLIIGYFVRALVETIAKGGGWLALFAS